MFRNKYVSLSRSKSLGVFGMSSWRFSDFPSKEFQKFLPGRGKPVPLVYREGQ